MKTCTVHYRALRNNFLLSFSVCTFYSQRWRPYFLYNIQHCLVCRAAPLILLCLEDAGIDPRTVVPFAQPVRRSNHLAGSNPHSARSHPQAWSDIRNQLGKISSTSSIRSHPHSANSYPLSRPYIIHPLARPDISHYSSARYHLLA